MKRFAGLRSALPWILGLVLFAGMIVWLVMGQVRQSVENGVTLCYAVEGAYPESLEYLTESYGVVFDEDKYLVHYECFAANVRPTVTVIRREN